MQVGNRRSLWLGIALFAMVFARTGAWKFKARTVRWRERQVAREDATIHQKEKMMKASRTRLKSAAEDGTEKEGVSSQYAYLQRGESITVSTIEELVCTWELASFATAYSTCHGCRYLAAHEYFCAKTQELTETCASNCALIDASPNSSTICSRSAMLAAWPSACKHVADQGASGGEGGSAGGSSAPRLHLPESGLCLCPEGTFNSAASPVGWADCSTVLDVDISYDVGCVTEWESTRPGDLEYARKFCCSETPAPTTIIPTSTPLPCNSQTQWVEEVTAFSSEYGGGWSASEVVGQTDVYPSYGDLTGSWTVTSGSSSIEWLELRFATAVKVGAVVVYETNEPGRLVKIQLLDENGQWDTVWSGVPEDPSASAARAFAPALELRDYKTRHVRIEADFVTTSAYYEIDAVSLVSYCPTTLTTTPPTTPAPTAATGSTPRGACTEVAGETCGGSSIGAGDTVYCEDLWGTPDTVCNSEGKCVTPANCDYTSADTGSTAACDNTCTYSYDGMCDEDNGLCDPGTDCYDCA